MPESRRVQLEAFSAAHVPVILSGGADWAKLAPFGAPYWRPRSEAELLRKVQSQAGPGLAPEYNFVIVADEGAQRVIEGRTDSAIAGECSIHTIDYRNRVGQVGVAIWDPELRHRGHGREATTQLMDWATGYLGLRRLEAWIVDGNDASRRMFEGLDFVHEGTLRGRYLCAGSWLDMNVYGLVVNS